MVTVSPSLVGNNDISDCHRFCSLVLETSATTQCKFAFPDGNRLSLVVLDDEGRSLDLPVCTPIHIHIPDIRMHTIAPMEFPHEYFVSFLQLSCHSSSLFTPFSSICPLFRPQKTCLSVSPLLLHKSVKTMDPLPSPCGQLELRVSPLLFI